MSAKTIHTDEVGHAYNGEEFHDVLVASLDLQTKSIGAENDREKGKTLAALCEYLPGSLQKFVETQYEDEVRLHGKLVFASEREKGEYWTRMMAGKLFEMVTELEYTATTTGIAATTEKGEHISEINISHALIEIAKHPKDYGLLVREGRRIPDAVYVRMNPETSAVTVEGLGEAKLPAHLDARSEDQLSPEGSRETMRLLIREINTLIAIGSLPKENEKLKEFLAMIGNKKIKVAEALTLDVIRPSNLDAPNADILAQNDLKGELVYAQEQSKFNRVFEGTSGNRDALLTEVKKGSLKFINSRFSSTDIGKITDSIFEESTLGLSFPGEIRGQEKVVAEQATAAERIAEVARNADADSAIDTYGAWLHFYLDNGSNVDLARERKKLGEKNAATFSIESDGNYITALHELSGLSVRISVNEGNDKTAQARLKDVLDAHLQDWREVLAASGVMAEAGRPIPPDDRGFIDKVLATAIEKETV